MLGEFLIKRSVKLGLSLLLKHVFSGKLFFASYSNKNCNKYGSVSSALKSPIIGIYFKFGDKRQLFFPNGLKSNHPFGLEDGRLHLCSLKVSSIKTP